VSTTAPDEQVGVAYLWVVLAVFAIGFVVGLTD
jgi:hypothetical protein